MEIWLNLAEIELSVMTRQCPRLPIPSETELARELSAWENEREWIGNLLPRMLELNSNVYIHSLKTDGILVLISITYFENMTNYLSF